jgi:hypothetical protein
MLEMMDGIQAPPAAAPARAAASWSFDANADLNARWAVWGHGKSHPGNKF